MAGVIQQSIYEALTAAFDPSYLVVTNESHQHNVPPGSESHFKVIVVSESFAGERLIQRHQRVNRVLAAQLNGQIHALSMHTYAQDEWLMKGEAAPLSPNCLGGGRGVDPSE
ncbi:MAG: BolA/IbaG family iron-sulfur metabolism protein [Pseudomonadales bacterium]|jgi:BolA protein|tara:strand:+ start:1181 stop:1516 length:336 start_codon:yes stop_codon:yes gene_type:complete